MLSNNNRTAAMVRTVSIAVVLRSAMKVRYTNDNSYIF